MTTERGSITNLLLLLLLILAGGILLIKLYTPATKQNPQSTSKKPAPSQKSKSNKYAMTKDFKYLVPEGWTMVNSEALQQAGAVSGIYTESLPITQFRVAVEAAATSPPTLETFKSTSLEAIRQFVNFKMLGEEPVEIDGEDGYQYIYRLGSDNMARQEYIIVLHNQQAFSLLFTGPESNFETQAAIIDDIIASFQFL